MAKETLIVSDIIDLDNGNLALAVGFSDFEKREALSEESNENIIQRYEGKRITIQGENYVLTTEIMRVSVSSSISKNIFFEISSSDRTGRIAEFDETHIDG